MNRQKYKEMEVGDGGSQMFYLHFLLFESATFCCWFPKQNHKQTSYFFMHSFADKFQQL